MTDAVVWQENEVTVSQITHAMKAVKEHAPSLWPKVQSVIDMAMAKGRLRA